MSWFHQEDQKGGGHQQKKMDMGTNLSPSYLLKMESTFARNMFG